MSVRVAFPPSSFACIAAPLQMTIVHVIGNAGPELRARVAVGLIEAGIPATAYTEKAHEDDEADTNTAIRTDTTDKGRRHTHSNGAQADRHKRPFLLCIDDGTVDVPSSMSRTGARYHARYVWTAHAVCNSASPLWRSEAHSPPHNNGNDTSSRAEQSRNDSAMSNANTEGALSEIVALLTATPCGARLRFSSSSLSTSSFADGKTDAMPSSSLCSTNDACIHAMRGGGSVDRNTAAGLYVSTRGECPPTNFISAIRQGLAADGGLYMRRTIPVMPVSQLRHFCTCSDLSYPDAAQTILEQLIDDSMSPETLYPMVRAAYAQERWSDRSNICPLTSLLLTHERDAATQGQSEQEEQLPREHVCRDPGNTDCTRNSTSTNMTPKGCLVDDGLHENASSLLLPPPSPVRSTNMGWAEREVWVLELYHGPTAAFKDFALQLFPRYFHAAIGGHVRHGSVAPGSDHSRTANDSVELNGINDPPNNHEAIDAPRRRDDIMSHVSEPLSISAASAAAAQGYIILAATSGDTGVAAISGFLNAGGGDRVKVMILYPEYGVSPVQQLQMLTLDNDTEVRVYGVADNFDFCQRTVKQLFGDVSLARRLAGADPSVQLSSANSINWGRLIPQVVYYFWAYRQYAQGKLSRTTKACENNCSRSWQVGDAIDVVVPCGNFGNVLAGYLAKLMGLPLRRLVVASNENDVLADFIATGMYDIRHRCLTTTASPSIDILRASNVERLLYLLAHQANNATGSTTSAEEEVRACMTELDLNGCFSVSPAMRRVMQETFWASRCSESACAATIQRIFKASGRRRLLDPHTAVAVAVAQEYRSWSGQHSDKNSGHTPNDHDEFYNTAIAPANSHDATTASTDASTNNARDGVDLDHNNRVNANIPGTSIHDSANDVSVIPLIVLSTAHWAKFPFSVLRAIRGETMCRAAEAGQPSTPTQAAQRVRACYDDILSAAAATKEWDHTTQGTGHEDSDAHALWSHEWESVHPALQQAMRCAEERACDVRRVAVDVNDIATEVERFATQ